jgi:hypothetical protein
MLVAHFARLGANINALYATSATEIASYYHIHRSKGKNQLAIQLEKLPDDKECESYTLEARQTELQLKKKSIKFCGVPGCTHFHTGQIQV